MGSSVGTVQTLHSNVCSNLDLFTLRASLFMQHASPFGTQLGNVCDRSRTSRSHTIVLLHARLGQKPKRGGSDPYPLRTHRGACVVHQPMDRALTFQHLYSPLGLTLITGFSLSQSVCVRVHVCVCMCVCVCVRVRARVCVVKGGRSSRIIRAQCISTE